MVTIGAILTVFTAIYCGMVTLFTIGWHKLPITKKNTKNSELPALSVVVCFRNEKKNLQPLLNSILCQTYQNFEVIFANDHSTDNGQEIIRNESKKNARIHLFDTTGFGKKNALREAVENCKNDHIFCCDADCLLPKTLFEEIATYHAKNRPDLLIGGVKYSFSGVFSSLQATEFGSLVASGAGSCGVNMPILCNGANLSFPKSTWEKFGGNLNEKTASGDDIFLLQNVKKAKGKIDFLKSPTTFVETQPAKSVKDFFTQHTRWASKTRFYTDWQTIFAAIVVFGWCFLWLINAIFAVFIGKICWLVIISWLAKLIIDCCLLVPFFCYSQQKKLILYIVPTAVIYPFYIVFTAINSLFCTWKWK